ncbi:MAG: hypothetical protein GX027_06785 [Clostridiaceae bacterium]|jgi:hypothetical protein|nr:hypothetical protein [Clostridiaceae bacterium]
MNEQVTRALYLGCCLMMIVSAFTAFFSAYHDYQAYVSHVHDFTSQHGVAREELFIESDVYITGREVAGLVLARRKAESKRLTGELYQENQYQPVFEEYPEVVVNGVSFIDVRIEDIDPDSLFRCDIAFDLYGKPVKMEIRGR